MVCIKNYLLCLLNVKRQRKNDSKIYSSRYYHWNKEEQDSLLRTVTFHMVINRLEFGIEKTSSDLETKVLEK